MKDKTKNINWANYHTHSFFCDGVGELELYVLKAIEKKMSAIGFSSHAPLFFHSEENETKSQVK